MRYLNDYATKLKLKVQYNTNIKLVSRNDEGDDALFHLTDQNGTTYTCKNVIMRYIVLALHAGLYGTVKH